MISTIPPISLIQISHGTFDYNNHWGHAGVLAFCTHGTGGSNFSLMEDPGMGTHLHFTLRIFWVTSLHARHLSSVMTSLTFSCQRLSIVVVCSKFGFSTAEGPCLRQASCTLSCSPQDATNSPHNWQVQMFYTFKICRLFQVSSYL